ncbi:MAG TPA: ankyrin repeat domain-containing protein [Steroidobacteraceae bacterium]|nr:ankyrin repeat domain-containing protein [Steroidobacteraceae bacterium]
MNLSRSLLVLSALVGLVSPVFAQAPQPDFARDVQPIFKKHCYECHGPDKHKNGYRLDRRSAAFGGLVRHNIIAGNSDSSRLYRRVLNSRLGPQMPLEDTLSEEQIDTLRRWIDAGAHWPDELANESDLPPPDAAAVQLAALVRTSTFDKSSRRKALAMVRAQPSIVNARGVGGTPPLMEAALYGDVKLLAAMLDAGGDPNLRNYRATSALMWAVDDIAKVRLLLDRGADPNASSDFGATPLTLAAASKDSAPLVQLLLDRGAEATLPALVAAARANPDAVRILLARVPDKGGAAATMAVRARCDECLAILQPDPKSPMPRVLAILLPPGSAGDPQMLRAAMLRSPDVNVIDPRDRSPLMQAAISESVPPDVMQEIIARGANVHAVSLDGLNALDYARTLGRASTIDVLTRAGAKPTRAGDEKPLEYVRGNDTHAAVARSMPLLLRSSETFYEKGGCVSCHHNLLGLVTAQTLRRQGLPLDEKIAASELRVLAEDMATSRDQALQGIVVPGGLFTTTGYILIGLAAGGHPADAATDALVRLLRRGQFPDGRWVSPVRPPSEASMFTATAVSLRGIQLYGNPRSAADRAAIASATAWLRKAAPENTEDATFQLLGLTWARAPASERRAAIDALLAAQKPNGGWAQLDYRAPDAYATGQVLVALHEAGVSARSPAYQRGVRYLLDTQLTDGSWLVPSRTLPTQIYFESGFPHGVHQFISAAGTQWATQALAWSIK